MENNIIYFIAFIVPGFVSMQIYGLIKPRQKITLKDTIYEAGSYGAINIAILFIPIRWFFINANSYHNIIVLWVVGIVLFLITPCIWPIILIAVRHYLEKKGLVLIQAPTAWDHFFQRQQEGCWVLVHISETRRIGGWFGTNSYASSYPDQGSLYIEELWELDDDGGFIKKQPQSCGILLRPEDYDMVEFFHTESPDNDEELGNA